MDGAVQGCLTSARKLWSERISCKGQVCIYTHAHIHIYGLPEMGNSVIVDAVLEQAARTLQYARNR